MSGTLSKQVGAISDMRYEEELDHNAEWFSQINSLVGADPEEPAVNSVSDFVHKAMLDREVLKIIRDENEVNKKNIFKFSEENTKLRQENKEWRKRAMGINIVSRLVEKEEENMKLQQENSELKRGHAAMRSFASTMFESMDCCPYTGNEKDEFSYYVKDCELNQAVKIQKEEDGSVWEDMVEELKEAASKKIKAQEEENMKLRQEISQLNLYLCQTSDDRDKALAEVKRLIDWDKTTCDFCENDSSHLVRRDAGHDERTCDYCHKEQYPEEYEEK